MKTKLLLSSLLSFYFSLLSSQITDRVSYEPVCCNGSALVSFQETKENETLIKDNFFGSIGPLRYEMKNKFRFRRLPVTMVIMIFFVNCESNGI